MMGFFDDLIKQRDGEFIPVWQWVHDLAITHNSDVKAVIAELQENHKDLTVYRRNDNAIYTPKSKVGLSVYDERTVFESDLNTLKSYIDSFTGELNVYELEHDTASNPTHTDYLKKSELPTFGEQAPSMAGVNDDNSPMNAGEIIAGLQTRILDLQRQQNATTANDDSQQQIADLQAENARLQAENTDLQARIAELESELNQATATPAIKHTNTALQALHDVLVTHWQDYDPTNETTKPKQEYIERWIMENYPELNQSKARWIDKIIRHGTHE